MGKLTLLIMMAAVIGGSILTLHTRTLTTDTARERSEAQHDLLARDAAISGQSLILAAMMDEGGFRSSLDFNERTTAAGQFTVDNYQPSADRQTVTFTVTGHSGGATHTVRSKYEWDPMDFPGPLWLDVPYATAQVDTRATLNGGPGGRPAYFDQRLFNQLRLGTLVSFNRMRDSLSYQIDGARGSAGSTQYVDMLPLLDDLNVSDARDLYYAAMGAMDAGDPIVTGPTTLTGTATHTGNKIAHYTGDLTIGTGGVLRGDGALVVEGALRVEPGGELEWDGLVIVHSDLQLLPVELNGKVTIDGSLVVSQMAVPPGGHMDFTVNRDLDGNWSGPEGNTAGSPWGGGFPWYQHKHRFDVDLPEGLTVYFAEAGRDRHEEWSQLRNSINALGSRQVYLEFDNEQYHGYASYTLDIAGEPQVYTGMVKNGFGPFADSDVYRSLPFAANALQSFVLDVRSLRMLRERFDDEGGCNLWPMCVGRSWGRREALTIRLADAATGQRLYEGSLYWHMRTDELALHLEEEAEWRDRIEAGEAFGTALRMGELVQINFEMEPIEAIGRRLGFDGDEMIHRGSWASHHSPDQNRAMGGTGGGNMVCHTDGTEQITLTLPASAIQAHLRHGDTPGPCSS